MSIVAKRLHEWMDEDATIGTEVDIGQATLC